MCWPTFWLAPPPPGVDARAEDARGDDQERQQRDVVLLRGRHRNPAVVGFFWADRDQVLLLCQPADHVHEQIAVALDAQRELRREVGVPDDDYAGFGLRRVERRRGRRRRRGYRRRNRDRSFLVALRLLEPHLACRQQTLDVGSGPALW